MKAGDIILFKGTTPIISPLIRWVTGSPYTHVGVYVAQGLVFEIDIDRRLGLHKLRDDSYDAFRLRGGLSQKERRAMKKYMLDQIRDNRGYDWLQILSFGFEKVFRTKRAFEWKHRVICSEIINNLYEQVGITLLHKDHNISPGDIAKSKELVNYLSYDKEKKTYSRLINI